MTGALAQGFDFAIAATAMAGFSAGLAVGFLHFLTLGWNVDLYMKTGAWRGIALHVARFVALIGAFVLLAWFGAAALLSGALGLVIARGLVLRRKGRVE